MNPQIDEFKKVLYDLKVPYLEKEDMTTHSTMKVSAFASIFVDVTSLEILNNIIKAYRKHPIPVIVIGEGSNTLFKSDFEGLVMSIKLKGIEIISEDDESALIKVAGGEIWHDFVNYCVDKNLAGNENLAYIPGTVGAAPVQNIAAYGQVQEDTFESLDAVDILSGEITTFNKEECRFDYRTSVFKANKINHFIIMSVNYRLYKVEEYIPETSYHSRYESLKDELALIAKPPYKLRDVFNAVVSIRKKKLPQVEQYGTLGSFFLNPFITREKLTEVQKKFPNIQFYPVDKMQYPGLEDEILKASEIVKIPAGWLLEELGWKGKFEGNIGTFEKHALCVVTKGPANGGEVVNFIEKMRQSVFAATGIQLQTEINIV